MKKLLGTILLAVVAAAISFYFYQVSHQAKIASLESLVPEEALYYVYSYNLNKKIEALTSSQFFHQILGSSVYGKFIKPEVEKFAERVPFVNGVMESDTAFAAFSLANAKTPASENDFGSFLLLARVDAKKHARIKKAVADFYLLLTARDKSAYEKYKGIQITSYTLPSFERTVHYALVSDVVVFSNDIGILRKCIDLARTKASQGSLLANPDFQSVSAKAKKDALLWGYSNTKRYYQEMVEAYTYNSLRLKEEKGKKPLQSFANMKPMIDLMNTLIGYSFYLDYDDLRSGLIVKFYTFFNSANGNNALLSLLMQDKAVDEGMFKMVPKDSLAYYGVSQDIAKSWIFLKEFYVSLEEMINAQMKSNPRYYVQKEIIQSGSFAGLLTMVESFLGVNIEKDIISALGDNLGVALAGFEDVLVRAPNAALSDAQETSFIFPQVYAFCELKDSLKMQNVMWRLMQSLVKNVNHLFGQTQNPKGQSKPQAKGATDEAIAPEEKQYLYLREKEYNGVTIYSIDIADFPIDSLKLNYCIIGKYIVVSLSTALTEKIIDVYNHKLDSFDSNYYFESAHDYLTQGYSNVMFFDFKKIFDTLKATKSFGAFTDKLPRGSQRSFSGKDLNSLISVLENLKAFTATHKLLDSETIGSSAYIEIEGL